MKRSPLVRRQPMRRTALSAVMPLIRKSRMKQRRPRVRAAERRAYTEATENARTTDGYLICANCGRSLIDGQEHRHHIKHRSQLGKTVADNLEIRCPECHDLAHGIRRAS